MADNSFIEESGSLSDSRSREPSIRAIAQLPPRLLLPSMARRIPGRYLPCRELRDRRAAPRERGSRMQIDISFLSAGTRIEVGG